MTTRIGTLMVIVATAGGALALAGCPDWIHSTTELKQDYARKTLAKIGPAVERYFDANGGCREDLRWELLVPGYLDKVPEDPWGRPYVIRCARGGVSVGTYGADLAAGGVGENRDIFWPDLS